MFLGSGAPYDVFDKFADILWPKPVCVYVLSHTSLIKAFKFFSNRYCELNSRELSVRRGKQLAFA